MEFSDDLFILRAEDAKKHIEPPKLTTLAFSPEAVRLKPGDERSFAAAGQDQHGRPIDLDGVMWTAAGGMVDGSGVVRAGEEEGVFPVSAAVGAVAGSARVVIARENTGDGGPSETGYRVAEPRPAWVPTHLSWSGEVPHQKWMNLYTRVLSHFAQGGGLKLTVKVDVSSPSGIPAEQVEQMRGCPARVGRVG